MSASESMIDERAVRAAANNADWYTMMFDVHGLGYERSSAAFTALDAPPAYHSWVVALDPEADEFLTKHLAAGAAQHRGFTCKDSYRSLDLEPHGLVELFSANWIWAEAVDADADAGGWRRITAVEDLHRWEAAWKQAGSPTEQRQFPDSILAREDVAVFGRSGPGGFEAGAVANASHDCVGLSNCFGRDAIGPASALAQIFGEGRPVTGYEQGVELAEALGVGFENVGPLTVWTVEPRRT